MLQPQWKSPVWSPWSFWWIWWFRYFQFWHLWCRFLHWLLSLLITEISERFANSKTGCVRRLQRCCLNCFTYFFEQCVNILFCHSWAFNENLFPFKLLFTIFCIEISQVSKPGSVSTYLWFKLFWQSGENVLVGKRSLWFNLPAEKFALFSRHNRISSLILQFF